MEKVIRRALVSVYHKEGLAEILKLLHEQGVEFVSTGGTSTFIEGLGYPCVAVEDLTKYPSMLGGRVKTLHPAIQGGILARRGHETDQKEVLEYGLSLIDLVIVDLYPFEATVASGASEEDIIEKIDIGGISLIRGAAKNFEDVVIIPSQADYATLLEILRERGARTTLEERRHFARRAFAVSSHYDSAISATSTLRTTRLSASRQTKLSPCATARTPTRRASSTATSTATSSSSTARSSPTTPPGCRGSCLTSSRTSLSPPSPILKHNNACGCASRPTLLEAWTDALAGDPVSAFGGVLVANRPIDVATAREIDKLFLEVLIAPDFEAEALTILEGKKNRILLRQKEAIDARWSYRSMLGGVLAQETDRAVETTAEMKPVTKVAPTAEELTDLVFATKLVKHSKSNAIVLGKGGQLIASGVGQTSRVDALKQAIEKARHFGFTSRELYWRAMPSSPSMTASPSLPKPVSPLSLSLVAQYVTLTASPLQIAWA